MNRCPPALLAQLQQLDACTLCNVIESFQVRLRNEGFAHRSIHSQFPELPPMVGHVATLRIRGGSPPMGGHSYTDRTDWWDAVLALPAPRVLVIEDVGREPGVGAFLGEVHVNIAHRLGCVGAVTNGSVRDLPALEALRFPVFAAGPAVSHSYVHLVDIGADVNIGGLRLKAGDLIHGDRHGIQSVPFELLDRIPEAAARMKESERAILAVCQQPGVTLEQLRAAVTGGARK